MTAAPLSDHEAALLAVLPFWPTVRPVHHLDWWACCALAKAGLVLIFCERADGVLAAAPSTLYAGRAAG